MTCGIYCLTSPSGKSYIGQSVNIERRFSQYKRLNCVKQTRIFNALSKYGHQNFNFCILEECGVEELNESEKFWISYIGSNQSGYNMSNGDKTLSKESRDKISIKNKGRKKNPLSQETKNKIKNSLCGRVFTEEWKQKIKNSKTGLKRKPFTEEHKINIGNNSRGKSRTDDFINKITSPRTNYRNKNINWGIKEYETNGGKRFYVQIKSNKKTIWKYGFCNIEQARLFRDGVNSIQVSSKPI